MTIQTKTTWRKRKLGEIAQDIRESYLPTKDEKKSYVGLEHIEQQTLQFFDVGRSDETQSAKKVFKAGDVLFGTLRPYFRKVVRPKFDGVCSTDIAVIRPTQKGDGSFLKYFIANQDFIDYASNIAGGTRMPRANWKTLKETIWSLPELDKQKQIADVLSAYDDLIENNTKRIKILEQIAQAIYREWFVHFRFPGHEKVKMIDSKTEFGKIPEGWEVKSILVTEYFAFINENIKRFMGSKIYYATADISGITISGKGENITFENKPSRAQKQPTIFSAWFARMKDTYKVLGFTESNLDLAENSVLSSGFAGFSSSKSVFPFLYYTINSEDFHRIKDLYCTGATQMSLTNDGLEKILILEPIKKLIFDYGQKVLPMIDELFLLQKQNQNLRQARDLLLPKLVSGEIRI